MKQTKYTIILVAIAAVLILAGCRMVGPEPTPTPKPAEQAALTEQRVDLIGTSWEVEFFGEAGGSLPVLPDTKLTLNMMIERYGGYNGCNWFLGVYDINGAELRYFTPATTAFICEDDTVSAQASTYMSALVNITRYEMDDEKLVTYTVGDQKMATFVTAEPVPLEGTNWTAKFVNDGERMTPASSYDFTVSALFEDGKLTGNGGCNDYEADYVIDGDKITITNIKTPGFECAEPAGANNVESWYLASLEATTSYQALITSMIFVDGEGVDQVFFGTP